MPNPQYGQTHSIADELFECVWLFCRVNALRVKVDSSWRKPQFQRKFQKVTFSQIYLIHLYYPKFIEDSEYLIHCDQKWTQHLLCSFFWDLVFEKFLKNSWKFFSNIFIVLPWILAIHAFSVHIHFFRPLPSMVSVSMLKYTKLRLKLFKIKLNQ